MRHVLHASLLLTPLLLLGLSGCDDPADSVPQARIGDSPETTPNDQNTSEAEAVADDDDAAPGLPIDTAASTLEFVGSKVTGSHTGHFGEWSGAVDLQEPLEESSVRIDIQMATIEADVARLTSHLRTDDFFDVAQFPTARFVSTAIAPAPADSGDATHLVTGHLTIRGTTETITFPAHFTVDDTEVRVISHFTIDRQRWGISYRGMEDDLIRDQVIIRFDVRAPR